MVVRRVDYRIAAENDTVIFAVGRHALRFSYKTAFDIAQGLRLAGNVAGRHAGMTPAERGEFKRAPAGPDVPTPTPKDAKGMSWAVRIDGARVALQIGNVSITMEPDDALTVASGIRLRGKEAKAWAGDRSRTVRAAGILTDAERNYARGFH